MSVAVRVSGEPPGRGTWIVPSRSFPGVVRTVIWITEGVSFCDCHGFSHRQECWHVDQVALAIEIEARQSLDAATPETRAEAAARLAHLAEEFAH